MSAPLVFVLKGAKLTCESREDDPEFNRSHKAIQLLMDSPLNKSRKIHVYVHTTSNVLIELSHLLEVPESPIEFSDVMSYLLRRLVVKSSDGAVLAKVIKNPIEKHLPPNSTKVVLSSRGCRMSPKDFEPYIERGLVFFINIGKVEKKEGEVTMKVSNFKLSPVSCCTKLTNMFEDMLGVF
ncbi:putative Mra1-like protein [Encephalitozoon romaleae SJ-2008]|uniref:Mra1-like protein n=1 Tax=Encephalitozoon romaleae (strain SJ-2008) TaxID=1178016 RepID=I6ZS03_ENCRO|nr:putative Mra1-like protein [Encephalitozoon romaleae SJ-2008]AFN82371.1 putative Mra1-like protein [Encephalitozoon romaleae SJ-2008]